MNILIKRKISIIFFLLILILLSTTYGMTFKSPSSTNISDYILVNGPISMEGISKNASGLTYDAKTNSLYVVINKPTQIVQLSTSGKFIRKIDLIGFSDTEGITVISENKFALVEEAKALLHFINISNNTNEVSINDVIKTVKIDDPNAMVLVKRKKNKMQTNGLEALDYDSITQTLWLAKEKKPQKIYTISLDAKGNQFPASEPWRVEKLGLGDISGLTILPKLKHVLILSDKSSQIIEATLDGKFIAALNLQINGSSIQDAEGIATDNKGNLYICAEPNELFIFRKFKKQN